MEENKKFAVIIATYRRKNGTSYNNLLRVHKFLMNQTYQNFKVFLVGDDYDNQEEFDKIVSLFPQDKIFSYNNNISYRTAYFKIAYNKWCVGGILARNIGIKQAVKEEYKYYLHLDDDDIWTNNHIEIINNTITDFPEVDFIVNKSKYKNSTLPKEFHKKSNIAVKYNNFNPIPRNSVHSSWTINLKTLGDKIINIYNNSIKIIDCIKNKEISEYRLKPHDASILKELNNLQRKNKIKCIFIPNCTVQKDTDVNIPE